MGDLKKIQDGEEEGTGVSRGYTGIGHDVRVAGTAFGRLWYTGINGIWCDWSVSPLSVPEEEETETEEDSEAILAEQLNELDRFSRRGQSNKEQQDEEQTKPALVGLLVKSFSVFFRHLRLPAIFFSVLVRLKELLPLDVKRDVLLSSLQPNSKNSTPISIDRVSAEDVSFSSFANPDCPEEIEAFLCSKYYLLQLSQQIEKAHPRGNDPLFKPYIFQTDHVHFSLFLCIEN